jgi:hypothetical protein
MLSAEQCERKSCFELFAPGNPLSNESTAEAHKYRMEIESEFIMAEKAVNKLK